jgi:hypothetical protein
MQCLRRQENGSVSWLTELRIVVESSEAKAERTLNAQLSSLNFLGVGFRLGKADDFAALFPLAALFQELDPLETFQDVAFSDDSAGASKAAMLRHKTEMSAQRSVNLALFKRRLPIITAGSSEPRARPKRRSDDKCGTCPSEAAANGGCDLL